VAWSPGTNGPVAANVVLMDARSLDDYQRRFAGRLQGAWVMLGPAQYVVNAADPPRTRADSDRVDTLIRANAPKTPDERRFFDIRYSLLAREQIAGIIHDGAKAVRPVHDGRKPAGVSPMPQIVIGNDVYAQFQRLLRRGETVRIEADIKNSFTRDTLRAYNTVAEIRGSERPNEVVILGAHLDSWDIATGGTDNGAGAIAVLEAARILKAAGVRPKRTIRFVLFTGEEQGLFGSQEYVFAHERELDRIQALLVLDNGTGRITGWRSRDTTSSGTFGVRCSRRSSHRSARSPCAPASRPERTISRSFPMACRASTTISCRAAMTRRITRRWTTITTQFRVMWRRRLLSWR
jgi:hypothetical protein